LFGEVVVGEEDAAGEAGAVLHPAVGVLVGVLEGEGAQGIEPLAAGEHEERGGAGHLGDVVAVADQWRAVVGAVEMAEVHPSLAATTR
jgi:hypothetical protein